MATRLSLSSLTAHVIAAGVLCGVAAPNASALSDAEASAAVKQIYERSGVKGGFVVHVGATDGALTAALKASESYTIHGLAADAKTATTAREAILKKGAYGPVCVDAWNGKDLPYVEGTVNLLVVEDGQKVSTTEIDRVLSPLGVALVKQGADWKKTEKAWPAEMDEWTHYYHDASGNAVSHDKEVGPPERLQWLGSPRWSRHHDRMSSLTAGVSAKGRLFYIMDEGSRISILLPSHWQLIARNAFNGVVLWKREIEKWNTNMWPLKSGPTQLTRRLVADGDRIFVTLGITDAVSCIDGATGATVKVYEETKGAEEMMFCNGILYALVNKNPWVLEEFAPRKQSDQGAVETEYNWDQKPRVLMAIDPDSGKVLWQKEGKIAPITLACDGKRLVYYNGDNVECLDPKTGEHRWASEEQKKRKLYEFNFGPRVLIQKDVVFYAGGDGTMKAIHGDTGKDLWIAPHEKSGYRSPEDLIVTGGLVWNAPDTSGNQSGEFTGRDLLTGEVKKQFKPDVPEGTYWFHHRCYIAKATDNYIMPSRTGIEYVDYKKGHWDLNHWVRGACLYGVLPANGVTMAGPHNCACYPEAKLFGMNALAPKAKHPLPAPIAEEARLEKGPAYDDIKDEAANPADWPTYRHDNERSGYTKQEMPKDAPMAWEVKLGGKLSAVTVAGGRAFVSQVDTHTLWAFDADTGKEAWHYTAGSRIDSPPTYWKGRAIFGCSDGNVYCLRASDGALVWRFRAAATDLRLFAFETLESVWPVNGSVLVENDTVNFVCGRSCFLDGGMKFIKLDAKTGAKMVEVAYDHLDPESGKDLQMLHKTLQMPTALNDILSSNGKGTLYLRSQKIEANTGKRFDIAPVSGNAIEQGAAQHGNDAHIFAAFGYLDQEWFHRALWIFGEHSAGGHNGYYQPGKYTPTGNILVFDDKNVYSFGREAKYFKWTTTMERTLFSASKEAPQVTINPAEANPKKAGKGGKGKQGAKQQERAVGVSFADNEKLNPANTPLTVACWIMADDGTGAIVNHGGPRLGYELALQNKKPGFHIRSGGNLVSAQSEEPLREGWHHLCGVLTERGVKLYVDGQLAAEAGTNELISGKPAIGLSFGNDVSHVAESALGPFSGMLDQVVILHRALSADEVLASVSHPEARPKDAVLFCNFDNGDPRDDSGNNIHGVSTGVETGKGKVGAALWFRKTAQAGKGGAAGPDKGSFVQRGWDTYVPIVTRSMTLAGRTLAVAGPPNLINEEYAFERMAAKDKEIQHDLQEQDASLNGQRGAKLWLMNVDTGEQAGSMDLDSPPVWDGMVVARGKLYVATVDGRIKCFGK